MALFLIYITYYIINLLIFGACVYLFGQDIRLGTFVLMIFQGMFLFNYMLHCKYQLYIRTKENKSLNLIKRKWLK